MSAQWQSTEGRGCALWLVASVSINKEMIRVSMLMVCPSALFVYFFIETREAGLVHATLIPRDGSQSLVAGDACTFDPGVNIDQIQAGKVAWVASLSWCTGILM